MKTASPSTLAIVLILMSTLTWYCYAQLSVGFYKDKCGTNDVESIIHGLIKQKLVGDPDTVSDMLRMSFHDCVTRGCEGSILLDGEDAEKSANPNLSLGGFDTIDDLKTAVENACPGVVSCSDVLVMAARSAFSLAGGQYFAVETGRKDGIVSLKSEALANIPSPTMPIPQVIKLFYNKFGSSIEDVVVLLGAHTVGTAHCHSFSERLYNFQNTNKPDPSISPALLQLLQTTCPQNSQTDNEANLDQTPSSQFTVDNAYYKQILAHNGTMEIDANLVSNLLTGGFVRGLAANQNLFFYKFGPAFNMMARAGVLTGSQGQIRKVCSAVNS